MGFFKKKNEEIQPQWKIEQKCLDLILECAKSSFPNEFGGLLRVIDIGEKKHIISEIVILPGTVSGESHAIFKLHMLPVDFTIIGTVHSHPSPSFHPSDADVLLFRKFGKVNIIVAYPYTTSSWRAYDYNGNEIEISIV